MTEALDLTPFDEWAADLGDVLDGAEMTAILLDAAEPMRAQWESNIRTAGEIGEDARHYADSLVIAPVFRKRTIATAEIAAAFTRDKDPFYPAVLEYGDADIVPRPVAIRAFDAKRREVVSQIADLTARKVTSRRKRGT